jgi:hypothetical protein
MVVHSGSIGSNLLVMSVAIGVWPFRSGEGVHLGSVDLSLAIFSRGYVHGMSLSGER